MDSFRTSSSSQNAVNLVNLFKLYDFVPKFWIYDQIFAFKLCCKYLSPNMYV